MASKLSTENLARISAAHPWRVIVIWAIVFLVAGGLAGTLFANVITTEIKFINDPESDLAQTFLEDRLRGERMVTDVLMLRSADLTVDEAAYRQAVEEIAGNISALGPEIVSGAPTYYQTGDESQVGNNRRSTIVPIVLVGGTADAEEHIAEVHSVVDAAVLPAGFEVFITGEATLAREFTVAAEEDLLRGEAIGIPVALIILVIVFGAVVAAIIPMVLAIVAIVVAIGSVAIIGQVIEMNLFVQTVTSRQPPS